MSLTENLQFVTGEELLAGMDPDEAALLEELLDVHGKGAADYAAGLTWLVTSETGPSIVQAHHIDGIGAAETLVAWTDILMVGLVEPGVSEMSIADRADTSIADEAAPEVPPVYLFAAGDVVWMVLTADQVLLEEAVTTVG